MISLAIPRIELGTRAEARTKEVERGLSMGADYILFLDTDQTMPDNAVEAMLKLDVDVAIINTPPHNTNLSNMVYSPDGTIAHSTIACSLIKSRVFPFIDKPWFSSNYIFIRSDVKDGKYTYTRLDKSTDDNQNEDIYFVRKCIDAGLTLGVVPNLNCNHFKL